MKSASKPASDSGEPDSLLWVDKYRPLTLRQLIGQQGDRSNMNKLLKWLRNWHRNLASYSGMSESLHIVPRCTPMYTCCIEELEWLRHCWLAVPPLSIALMFVKRTSSGYCVCNMHDMSTLDAVSECDGW